jgi:hypothetical protein
MEELEIADDVKSESKVSVKPKHIRMRYQQFFFDDDPLYKKVKNKPFYILIPVYLFLVFRVILFHKKKEILGALGGIVFWVGIWNLYESYFFPYSMVTEIITISIGVICFVALTLFFLLPPVRKSSELPNWIGEIVRIFRDIMAAFFAVAVWKGIYNLFDVYAFEHSIGRDVIYTVIGILIMIICNTLNSNTGV